MNTTSGARQTCARCGEQLLTSHYNCPSCGKTDLAALRRDLSRVAIQFAVFGAIVFGAFGIGTFLSDGRNWLSSHGQAIDDPFKPAPVKKKP